MKRFLAVWLLVIAFSCTVMAQAYEGDGFTVDVPAEWGDCTVEEGSNTWDLPDGLTSFIVDIQGNEEEINIYDLDDGDVEDVGTVVVQTAEQSMADSLADAGISCEPTLVNSEIKKITVNEQPCIEISMEIDLALEDGTTVKMLQYFIMQNAKEHIFTSGYAAFDEAALQEAMNSGVVETVSITEEMFDGPTQSSLLGNLFGSLFSSDILGGLLIGAVVGGLFGLLLYKKRS